MGREGNKEGRGSNQKKRQEDMEMTRAPSFTSKKKKKLNSINSYNHSFVEFWLINVHVPYERLSINLCHMKDSTKPLQRKMSNQ